jgi:hypothetical protein
MCGGLLLAAAGLAYAVWLLWSWGQAGGRHRRPRESAALQLLAGPDPAPAPAGAHPVSLEAEGAGADTDTVALLLDADTAGFAHCPAEGSTTPHFMHSGGSRTCCRCETTTAGDQT